MFFRQMLLIFWLSPTLIFWNRVVQGFLRVNSFGKIEEYNSLDSASWKSRDIYNQQQNVHDEGKKHNVHPAYQVSGDSSNQMADGNSNWGVGAISPLDELFNHPYSAPNLEETMNYYPQHQWNYAQVEHSSFSSQNHQKETYPPVGSSKDPGSSSSTYQPMYDGELFGGNHVNLVQHFDESHYRDSSVVPQPNQNFGIPFDHQMTIRPTSHSIQSEFPYNPHLSDMGDRAYQNQDWSAQDFNPPSSSHNLGSFHAGASFDHRRNLIDNENLIFDNSNSPTETDESLRERNELFEILNRDFRRISKDNAVLEILRGASKTEKTDIENFHQQNNNYLTRRNPEDSQSNFIIKGQTETDEARKLTRLKNRMIVVYTLGIDWDGSDKIKNPIFAFANKLQNFGNVVINEITTEHIKDISILGITFMKIIAKKFSNESVSKEFGDDNSLLNYTKSFWNFCFTHEGKTNKEFGDFFTSLGKHCSQEDKQRFLTTTFSREFKTPRTIFSRIKKNIPKCTDKLTILQYSWYFVFFRAIFYYPQVIFKFGNLSGDELKSVIEDGILYIYGKDIMLKTGDGNDI
ncbi:hypothetical protein PPACK8108_LOCUS22424 [Phakopsora pachyrhizi]|uniref:Uncharacterized protein n=1 Tax=Phakopsora pachyrhizi TaxID=170000 RepID=A0AAV0BMM0_PHAPC|nr:hypothetical protein PPACK8108_LOCUS22424 [Phakopsora pachyrhizi]